MITNVKKKNPGSASGSHWRKTVQVPPIYWISDSETKIGKCQISRPVFESCFIAHSEISLYKSVF